MPVMKIVTKKKIIVTPWAEISWLYVSGPTTLRFGCANCMRTISAKIPPIRNDRKPVVMYMIPISLWSVVVSHRLMGLKKESSYDFGRGGASVAISTYL